MKGMKNMAYIAYIIRNIATIICFTYLAVHFNHWWIILFSALFMVDIRQRGGKENKDEEG